MHNKTFGLLTGKRKSKEKLSIHFGLSNVEKLIKIVSNPKLNQNTLDAPNVGE